MGWLLHLTAVLVVIFGVRGSPDRGEGAIVFIFSLIPFVGEFFAIIALAEIIDRTRKSKGSCWSGHNYMEYSPRMLRVDMYMTLCKLDLFEMTEVRDWKDAMRMAKGSMISHYMCKKCKAKCTHRESL